MRNPRWRPRNGCDGRLMVKISITTIQVNLVLLGNSPELLLFKFLPLPTITAISVTTIQVNLVLFGNSPELLLFKFLPLTYYHSHFLAATLDFAFFHHSLSEGLTPFFTAWLFWIR